MQLIKQEKKIIKYPNKNTSDAILDFLVSKGVKKVFLLTGGAIAFTVDAFSKRKAFGFVTSAIQKSILDKKGTISFKISDVFNSSKYKYENFRDTFRSEGEGRWREPTYILTFNYRFNDNKYQQRKKNNRRGQGDFDEGGGEEPIFND